MSYLHEVFRKPDGVYRCKSCGLPMTDLSQVASHVVANQYSYHEPRFARPPSEDRRW